MIAPRDLRAAAWWPAALTLLLTTLALGGSLLVPLAFSDPNGVDPYVVRLSATSLLMLAAAYASRRLVGGRPVLLAIAAVTASFTLFSAGPQILFDLFKTAGTAQILWASLAQAAVTVGIAVAAVRLLPAELRPALRLGRFGWPAVVVSVAGVALLVLAGLALPAGLLGRDGIQPVAIARDMPWLGPACLLQAFAQEAQFRGMLMGGLERVMGRGWANLAQAGFFGLTHLAVSYQGPVGPFVPVTIAVGLALGWIAQRTRSLWPAVIIHAAGDIGITLAVLPGLYGF